MKQYPNIQAAAEETIYLVKEHGVREKAGIWQATELFKDHEMFVIRNEIFTIPVPETDFKLGVFTKCDQPWAEEHFQERIKGIPTNPGESYKRWPYNVFIEDNDPYRDGKKFSHTYQERFWPKMANRDFGIWQAANPGYDFNEGIRYNYGDLTDVIRQLKENPLTRQAYLPIFFPEDTGAVHKQRVPCTLGYYFYIQNDQLHINYIIRSCDIFRHFRNDLYLTGRLLQHVAKELGIETGNLTFICFHLHLFVNDLYALNKRENGKNK